MSFGHRALHLREPRGWRSIVIVRIFSSIAVMALSAGCNPTQPKYVQPRNETSTVVSTAGGDLRNSVNQKPIHDTADAGDSGNSASTGAASFTAQGIAFIAHGGKWLCIDRQERHLATLLTFDNGPDYVSEGLIRYEDANKIGFVDEACIIRIAARWISHSRSARGVLSSARVAKTNPTVSIFSVWAANGDTSIAPVQS